MNWDNDYQALFSELDRVTAERKAARKAGNAELEAFLGARRVAIIESCAVHCRAAFDAYNASDPTGYRAAMWQRRARIHGNGSISGIWDGRDALVSEHDRAKGRTFGGPVRKDAAS